MIKSLYKSEACNATQAFVEIGYRPIAKADKMRDGQNQSIQKSFFVKIKNKIK